MSDENTINIKLCKPKYIDWDLFRNKTLSLGMLVNLYAYESEYKFCEEKFGSGPVKLNTNNLRGCFRHYIVDKVNTIDQNSYNYVGELYKYDHVRKLTRDNIYSFF